MSKFPVSLVIICFNEAENIERCIRSVPFADEIIIVDSGSTDGTQSKAQSLGAKVFNETWKGFGPQKRSAVAHAKNDWVLCLDADEALSPELIQEIQNKFNSLNTKVGYQLPRRSFHLGRWIYHGGWYPDYQLRLFNRAHSNWNEAAIHEKVEAASIEKLNGDLLHYVFDGISDQVATNDRYSSLQAQTLMDKGIQFSLWKACTKPFVKFIENYFWKQGFRDGMPGFFIAISSGYSVFLKWMKLWELEKNAK